MSHRWRHQISWTQVDNNCDRAPYYRFCSIIMGPFHGKIYKEVTWLIVAVHRSTWHSNESGWIKNLNKGRSDHVTKRAHALQTADDGCDSEGKQDMHVSWSISPGIESIQVWRQQPKESLVTRHLFKLAALESHFRWSTDSIKSKKFSLQPVDSAHVDTFWTQRPTCPTSQESPLEGSYIKQPAYWTRSDSTLRQWWK